MFFNSQIDHVHLEVAANRTDIDTNTNTIVGNRADIDRKLRRMMAGAIGHYRGETAFALGASAAFNDGRAVAKFNGSVNTRGHAGISAGAGFAF